MKQRTMTSTFGTSGRINHNSDSFYDSNLYKEIQSNSISRCKPDNTISKELENTIIHGSSENMIAIPDNSVHLMITSPPYNVSKEYDDDLTLQEYLALLEKVFKETFRVLVDGGRACINVANIGRRPYIPISDYISHILIACGFQMRGEIIWNKGAGAGASTAWGSWQSATNPTLRDIHEYILIFSKGTYKRERNDKENTITKQEFMEYTKSIWTMNTESALKIGHPAPFPEELPYRLMQLYSFANDIILDPFIGSGTTAISALKTGRKFIGFEVQEEYIQLAKKRLAHFMEQK